MMKKPAIPAISTRGRKPETKVIPRYNGVRTMMDATKKGARLRSRSEMIGRTMAPSTPATTKTAPMIPASIEVIPLGSRMDSIRVRIVLNTPIGNKADQ